jgi:aldose 1-epimerase
VAGTPFDLRSPVRIGDQVRRVHPQVLLARGIDHTYVLGSGPAEAGAGAGAEDGAGTDAPAPEAGGGGPLRRAARVVHPPTGRTLEVWTDQPGLQVYTGNMLDGSTVGRGGVTHRQGDGLCLEPQHFPDSPNRPDYPSTVLRPGETYRSREVLRAGVLAGSRTASEAG